MKLFVSVVHLLCGMFLVHAASATSIIAVRVNEQVIVGADSKRRVGQDPQNSISIDEPVCKIGKGNGFFFAAAGVVKGDDFDVHSFIAEASQIQGTTEGKIETVLQKLKEPLTRLLDHYRQKYPTVYLRFANAPALQILFFGNENGSTFMIASQLYIPKPSPSVPVQIEILKGKCPGDLCPNGEQIVLNGEYEAISEFLKGKPDYWKVNPVETIRALIELQIADIPDLVGPPIDILQIDKSGARWIQKKTQCPDF